MKTKLLGLTTLLASTASQAAIDVSGPIGVIGTDGTAAVTAIGGAMLGLAAVAIVFKWAKAAIFG